ncbi:MAG: tetratricopeptide repeat protein [Pseudomonadota bacterium]
MSLINKMLQDLEARGSDGADAQQARVRPVTAAPDRVIALGDVLAVLIVLAVLGGGGVFGWRYWKQTQATAARLAAATPRAAPAMAPVKPAVKPAAPVVAPATAGVAVVPTAAPLMAGAAVAPSSAPAVAAGNGAGAAAPAAAGKPGPVAPLKPSHPAQPGRAAQQAMAPAPHTSGALPAHGPLKRATAAAAKPLAHKSAAPVKAAPPAPARAEGIELSAKQKSENAYRRALADLQEGRVASAVSSLEQSLHLDPQHEAARQTLVGLLIEAKRPEDAMRQLQLGLTLDARQPAMAMLLARLQIERGGPGVDTLMRTLPYAAGNAEYHGLLAGMLQRQQRQREAIEQYQAALQAAPQNGVWWMGLGISLQAEKRNAEALDAFQHAKDAPNLNPELRNYVERKLASLTH